MNPRPNDTCEDYKCEWRPEFGEHSHVGVRPFLRRVVDMSGKVVDGQTGEPAATSAD